MATGNKRLTLEQAFYELRFENAFLRAKGTAFQDLFNYLMGLAFRGDFMACRPWGNQGDQKNDGYLRSERRLFQVYAPYELTRQKATAKIKQDFEDARAHWAGHFASWTFVHNARDGLPPHVLRLVLELEAANPDITIELWGLEELRQVFRLIAPADLQTWFGPAPTSETSAQLGFKDLRMVLETIANQSAPPTQPVRDVPMGKIEANALSESVTTLLRHGMVKTPLAEEFFGRCHSPTFGEEVASSFRQQYMTLRADGLTPNEIFSRLQTWAGGSDRGTPEHEFAVVTIIAYFFGSCDIFEPPPGDVS